MLTVQVDREGDEVGVTLYYALDVGLLGVAFALRLQIYHDPRAPFKVSVIDLGDFEISRAVGRPAVGRLILRYPRHHLHLVAYDEAGVEAHAELSDNVRLVALVLDVLHELL